MVNAAGPEEASKGVGAEVAKRGAVESREEVGARGEWKEGGLVGGSVDTVAKER